MTSERTQAYGRVLRTLDDVGATKLHEPEQERIREAADTLIFVRARSRRPAPRSRTSTRSASTSSRPAAGPRSAPPSCAQDMLACGPLAPVG